MYIVVLGAQFGDEGKGKLLDFLMKEGDVCVRFNGGSNAGHTIDVGGVKYYTHVLPSGLIHPDKECIMGNGMVIGLENLVTELEDLQSKGIKIENRLKISKRAHVVLNIHKVIDTVTGKKIGTTGQGIGVAYSSKAMRDGMRIIDLLGDESAWKEKLDTIYEKSSILLGDEMDPVRLQASREKDYALIAKCNKFLKDNSIELSYYMNSLLLDTKNVIFEGANAIMLDIDHGTYPFVTSSTCSLAGVFSGTGMSPSKFFSQPHEIVGVIKAYMTRVGNGKLITEAFDRDGEIMQTVGGEIGVTTKRKRRCGWLDIVQLRYACMINGFTHLNITKLDILSEFDTVKICTSYTNTKTAQSVHEFPSVEEDLDNLEPIYNTYDGWKGFDLSTVTTYDELHPNIKKYLETIESLLNVHVKYINTGVERDQMLVNN